MDDLSTLVSQLRQVNSKFLPIMVDDLSTFLSQLRQVNLKFSITMMDDLRQHSFTPNFNWRMGHTPKWQNGGGKFQKKSWGWSNWGGEKAGGWIFFMKHFFSYTTF